ncbi:type II toxin-antitoxin system VapC family toxin [Streptomyces sp. B1I3]|uniref:type II toxin-antitoxin system VapC family toxin n=1 Tax=Streptomyces sp. B1I3 TaxID=3042264 RepID=UPI00277E0DD9|nr:type II toxin-antitoxin system VapC family toxin [Streptomyces sp. B1I3]MDQ0795930.1 PIN domain nuclease of toxin-antitoxin system [Streptomyces sp. B1I3]
MKLLLDTHVVLWWLNASDDLSDELRELLRTEAEAYVSAATPWEIAIKQNLGKLEGAADLAERARDMQFRRCPITAEHGVRAGRLPPLHRDPFDRILVAQAQTEGLTVVTRDKWIPQYDVPVLHA